MSNDEKILVMGVGNLILGDEGIGIHAIEYMKDKEMPENIEILDGGTGGFHLLSYFHDYQKILLIDATIDKQPTGSIKVIKPKFSKDFPKTLSSHDIGLKDLIESAIFLGKMPEIYLITVSITDNQPVQIGLSDTLNATLPLLYDKVREVLLRFNK
jgi:hydrogenase maturation protease